MNDDGSRGQAGKKSSQSENKRAEKGSSITTIVYKDMASASLAITYSIHRPANQNAIFPSTSPFSFLSSLQLSTPNPPTPCLSADATPHYHSPGPRYLPPYLPT